MPRLLQHGSDASCLRLPRWRDERDCSGHREELRIRQRAQCRVAVTNWPDLRRDIAPETWLPPEPTRPAAGLAREHAGAGHWLGRARRRLEPDRDRQGLLRNRWTRRTTRPALRRPGSIELADLNTFLDWMANAGHVRAVRRPARSSDHGRRRRHLGGHRRADDHDQLQRSRVREHAVPGVVTVTLAPTDRRLRRGQHALHDGRHRPALSSPTYTGPFSVNSTNTVTTVNFRSWDWAGNAEAVNTQVIQAPPDTVCAHDDDRLQRGAVRNRPYLATVSVTLSATDTGGSGRRRHLLHHRRLHADDDRATRTQARSRSTPRAATTSSSSRPTLPGTRSRCIPSRSQSSPVSTKVSLTFDNGTVSQYTLGYLQALQPHGATRRSSSTRGRLACRANIMTWAQLSTLAGAGNDIGGKTVNATNLTTDPNPTAQVCNDRTALLQHGLNPVAFAYPGGALNATRRRASSRAAGTATRRSAGSLSPTGPTYAETLPPKTGTRRAPTRPTGQVTLANCRRWSPVPRARRRVEPDRDRPGVLAERRTRPTTPPAPPRPAGSNSPTSTRS